MDQAAEKKALMAEEAIFSKGAEIVHQKWIDKFEFLCGL